ncbi:hypothetical protein RIN61_20495 [Pseudomonas inefficax]|uniref:hypothetical protein n=1 Tax=Pseudomonas inefficax TaxID=2078786 RepID=UPI0028BDC67D|nr:hypothetical protein [Pseudomonas inefficax]WNN38559.1 hypothetical protein RIN61_20495 [Pseudomonas inefficax]
MTHSDEVPATRAEFHRQHLADALAEAERLLARRDELQGAWLTWVAGELYRLGPPPYVAMVRRELQRLAQG